MIKIWEENIDDHLATPLYLDTPLEKPLLFLQQDRIKNVTKWPKLYQHVKLIIL